jgi:uncharacterized membrane protein YphA (DoxX/SURF4 family)
MPGVPRRRDQGSLGRALVASLFVSSCLLSVVSWYTTQQGMALYLSPWLSFLASLGVQSALVLVAWLVGITESRRGLLIAVYLVTASVSVAFSYASLHTWFAARERPAQIERRLYDALSGVAGQAQERLTAAIAEGERHVLALEEMTAAEKAHGYISRATDADPWLARVRAGVAHEAETYGTSYPEGRGTGFRYTAFDRHATLARQTVARLKQSASAIAAFQAGAKPLDPTDQQLRSFRQAFDVIPWSDVRETLHAEVQVPEVPAYSDFVDRSASGQEDLVIAFTEILTAPTSRHVLAFTLAAFIDLIVFLLASASGPFLFGAPERRLLAAAAALDGAEEQVFVRGLLHKTTHGSQGLPQIEAEALSPGERQLLLALASRGLSFPAGQEGRRHYLLDASLHRSLVESLAEPGLALRASGTQPAAA